LNSMLGAIAGAAGSIASTIANLLPHSPAREGPLSHLNEFMPGMIDTLTQGIEAGVPHINLAMRHLVEPIAAQLPATGGSFAGGRYPTGGGGTTINHIYVTQPDITLDGTSVVNKVGKRMISEIRRGGG